VSAPAAAAPAKTTRALSPSAIAWRQVLRSHTTVAALAIVVLIGLAALLAPWLAPHDPDESDLFRRLQPPAWLEGGEWAYALGCDGLGRDILSRLLAGAQISFAIGIIVIAIAVAIGTLAGLAAGYLRGAADTVLSRLADILLAFPYLIFAIGLMAMTGPGIHNLVLALVYREWVVSFRVVRGETLAAREVEYVEAARALGASRLHIMLREILPNILSPVLVVGTVRMASVIMLEASLSFLGLGVRSPAASWGSMVADGRDFLFDAWWVSTLPGIAILALVLAINVASQGLRDAFDPRMRT
jgi:ABC-type dipeptide/oligopeptide/nickel transport system permease subunit